MLSRVVDSRAAAGSKIRVACDDAQWNNERLTAPPNVEYKHVYALHVLVAQIILFLFFL